jgi:hypothetical protein
MYCAKKNKKEKSDILLFITNVYVCDKLPIFLPVHVFETMRLYGN